MDDSNISTPVATRSSARIASQAAEHAEPEPPVALGGDGDDGADDNGGEESSGEEGSGDDTGSSGEGDGESGETGGGDGDDDEGTISSRDQLGAC